MLDNTKITEYNLPKFPPFFPNYCVYFSDSISSLQKRFTNHDLNNSFEKMGRKRLIWSYDHQCGVV